MNILFIANSSVLYGANRSLTEMAAELQKQGHVPYIFFPDTRGKEKLTLKGELHRLKIRNTFLQYYPGVHDQTEKLSDLLWRYKANRVCLKEMIRYVEKWGIDIIHTNSFTHNIGAQLAVKTKRKHIWHIREALSEQFGLRYDNILHYQYLLHRTSRVICISNYVKEIYQPFLKGINCQVLYNGFHTEYYMLDSAYRKKPDIFHLVICGVLMEEKGQMDAVKAVRYLTERLGIYNIHLKIVGSGNSNYVSVLTKYIEKYHLLSYIEIVPFQTDLREVRREADIALVCSRHEALGRVTIESMLSENIVIGADSAGTAELIQDGKTGYLYRTGDAKALAGKIAYVMTQWKEQSIMINNAKKFAVDHFDAGRYADKIVEVYRSVLKK